MKNYYQILNVKPTATEDEIKRSYRVLAKRFHPDVNPGDKNAADKFADINEAHDTLSDPKKRQEYDKKLKEAAAPKPKPEDIIARQRAAAQEAARQAAMKNNMRQNPGNMGNMGGMGGMNFAGMFRDPTMTMAQRAAAAQVAAQAVAQAQAQAQAQAAVIEKNAYNLGHERGLAENRAKMEKDRAMWERERASLNSQIQSLKADLQKEKDSVISIEKDRSDLEQELFSRDREYSQAMSRMHDLEMQINMLKQSAGAGFVGKHTAADYNTMKEMLDAAQSKIRQLEQERNQAELKNSAQISLQQDKRKHLQEEIDDLTRQVRELTDENERLRSENEQWEQYAKSEDFLSDAEQKLQAWDKKQKADKKLAKPTLYGALGVLIWATQDEIDTAFRKLIKRFANKEDTVDTERLAKIKEAYAVLSDPDKRRAYNKTIDITDERIEEERKLIEENESVKEEYRSRMASKEFWANFDEMAALAMSGDAGMQNKLGEMYYKGDEIDQDLDQAAFWFKEAAKQKHPDGMYNLGICYLNGEGVDKNSTTGLGFIRIAADLGSSPAKVYMQKNKK